MMNSSRQPWLIYTFRFQFLSGLGNAAQKPNLRGRVRSLRFIPTHAPFHLLERGMADQGRGFSLLVFEGGEEADAA
jgi:hypothetical protein